MSVPFNIPDYDNFVDRREDLPGNGMDPVWPFFYNDLKNFIGIAIHHSAGPASQSVESIAQFHVTARGWGGIGYHFVIEQDGKINYVGDLNLGRAHVGGLNDKYIGVCMVGNFMEDRVPTDKQLQACHMLCREFIENESSRFPNVNDWEDMKPHGELGSTACPGSTRSEWWVKIKFGTEDDSKTCEEKLDQCMVDLAKVTEERNHKDEKLEICREMSQKYETLYNHQLDLNADLQKEVGKWKEAYEKMAMKAVACEKEKEELGIKLERCENQDYTPREAFSCFLRALFKN